MHTVKDTDTPFEVAHNVFAIRPPQWAMMVVVKATFSLVPEGTALIAPAQLPCQGGEPNPGATSLKFDSDLALIKPRRECYLAGSFHAPGGVAVRSSSVALQVGDLTRTVAVFGDRYWQRTAFGIRPTEPEPITTLPLTYERAYGGPGFEKNPLGKGFAEVTLEGRKVFPLPNLEDPQRPISAPDQRPDPASLFPTPPDWPARRRRMGTFDAKWKKNRWPFFPEDFDPRYYNSAPEDLQGEGFWTGAEEVALKHLHPEYAELRSKLPGIRPRVFLERAGGDLSEVDLRCDTIVVDAENLQAYGLWRGLVDVVDDTLAECKRLYVSHEAQGASRGLEAHREKMYEVDGPPEAEPEDEGESIPTGAEKAGEGATAGLDASLAAAGVAGGAGALALAGAGEAANESGIVSSKPLPRETTREQAEALRHEVIAKREARADLTGADLTGANLSALDLSGADLTGSILQGANLSGTNLAGAKLDGADVSDVDFTGTNLEGASLRGADATRAKFRHAKMTGAVLEDLVAPLAIFEAAVLRDGKLTRADLSGARCAGAFFINADLTDADLTRTDLTSADFTGANLSEARLIGAAGRGAKMRECNLSRARMIDGARFPGADFEKAKAAESLWAGAELAGANFRFAELARADFAAALLAGAKFDGADVSRARFPRAQLAGASMLRANAMEANFEAADLTDADARGANLYNAQLWRAVTGGTRLELSNLDGTLLAGRERV